MGTLSIFGLIADVFQFIASETWQCNQLWHSTGTFSYTVWLFSNAPIWNDFSQAVKITKSWSILHLKGLEKLFMLHLLLFGRRPCRGQWPMVLSHIDISPFSFFFLSFYSSPSLWRHLRISPSFSGPCKQLPLLIPATLFEVLPYPLGTPLFFFLPLYGPHLPSPPSEAPSSISNIVLITPVVMFGRWASERVMRALGVMRPQRM